MCSSSINTTNWKNEQEKHAGQTPSNQTRCEKQTIGRRERIEMRQIYVRRSKKVKENTKSFYGSTN